jgi:MFS family permease
MKKWLPVIVLACAQFVMVLDSTVMNVSISTVVKDLDTTVEAMQAAITFYALTMAAMMILGAKLGDVWGRRRAFVIGAIVYAIGSFITAISPNIFTLFMGWSVIEGLGAVLVIPAIAALVADNYTGRDRITAYAIIGAISGAAVAAGPLIGGFVTTYFDWRYVFAAEVVIMAVVLLGAKWVRDAKRDAHVHIDILSVLLSAASMVLMVYGMLQSKEWGWFIALQVPEVAGIKLTVFGLSIVPFLILIGAVFLRLFWVRQQKLAEAGRTPLVDVSMFSLAALRSGLAVLGAQYAIIGGVFFMIPIYLQMTLGLDALETGMRIFPLSLALMLFSFVGTKLSGFWSPRRIVRVGQVILVVSILVLLASVTIDLRHVMFAVAMFTAGAGLGLLASQLGNVNMSAVDESRSSEVGGVQGVFQNLGSSLGTALIGSVLIFSLTSNFAGAVAASSLPDQAKTAVAQLSTQGVSIIPAASVSAIAESKGMSTTDAQELTQMYTSSQVAALRVALFGMLVFSVFSMAFSRNIPSQIVGRKQDD